MKMTQKRLKELLDYDPETGFFTWKHKIISQGRVSKKSGNVAGCVSKHLGYVMIDVLGSNSYAHRLAFLYMEGFLPKNIKVDHVNRKKTDNRWVNLRLVSDACNARNCSIAKNNKTGVMGVSIIKSTGKYRASILGGKSTKNLGHFECVEDAVKARWEAEKQYDFPTCQTTSSAYIYLKERGLL